MRIQNIRINVYRYIEKKPDSINWRETRHVPAAVLYNWSSFYFFSFFVVWRGDAETHRKERVEREFLPLILLQDLFRRHFLFLGFSSSLTFFYLAARQRKELKETNSLLYVPPKPFNIHRGKVNRLAGSSYSQHDRTSPAQKNVSRSLLVSRATSVLFSLPLLLFFLYYQQLKRKKVSLIILICLICANRDEQQPSSWIIQRCTVQNVD